MSCQKTSCEHYSKGAQYPISNCIQLTLDFAKEYCRHYKKPTSELRERLAEYKKYIYEHDVCEPDKEYYFSKAIVDKLESLEERIK